jgi:hypothetical protein
MAEGDPRRASADRPWRRPGTRRAEIRGAGRRARHGSGRRARGLLTCDRGQARRRNGPGGRPAAARPSDRALAGNARRRAPPAGARLAAARHPVAPCEARLAVARRPAAPGWAPAAASRARRQRPLLLLRHKIVSWGRRRRGDHWICRIRSANAPPFSSPKPRPAPTVDVDAQFWQRTGWMGAGQGQPLGIRAGLARDHRAGMARTYWPTTTSLICITGLRSV